MSQDNGSTANSAKDEVDIDNLEVDLLIIAKTPSNLRQTSAYLERRGWPSTVITNISKAIEHISEKRPDFVLLSYDHPSPALAKLPDLIAQTFNIPCVAFVETNQNSSAQKLTQLKMKHKIFGSPSGPNFQRTIRRILAEKFNVQIDDKTGSSSDEAHKGDKQGSINIRGNAQKDGSGSQSVSGKIGADGSRSVRSRGRLGPDGQPFEPFQGHEDESGNISVTSSRSENQNGHSGSSTSKRGTKGYAPGANGGSDSDDYGDGSGLATADGDAASGSESGKSSKRSRLNKNGSADANGEGFEHADGSNENSASQLGAGSKALRSQRNGLSGKNDEAAGFGNDGDANSLNGADGLDSDRSRNKRNGANGEFSEADWDNASAGDETEGLNLGSEVTEAPHANYDDDIVTNGKYTMGGKRRRSLKDLAGPEAADVNLDAKTSEGKDAKAKAEDAAALAAALKKSLFGQEELKAEELIATFQRSVENAFKLVCEVNSKLPPLPVAMVTRVGVFPVDSGSRPGYVIMAMQKEYSQLDDEHLRRCQGELAASLKKMNPPIEVQPAFWVDLPYAGYEMWTESCALFSFKLEHMGFEVGVAFFETNGPIPKALPDAKTEMFKVSLDLIPLNEPVSFKAYLHLHYNQRFYLYLRNGRKLQEKQRNRLKGAKIDEIYIKAIDVENLRVFLARNFLAEMINGIDIAA